MPQEPQSDDEDLLDQMLADLEAPNAFKNMSPEEQFYHELTVSTVKIYNCKYWLDGQIKIIYSLEYEGKFLMKSIGTGAGLTYTQIPKQEIGRSLLKIYFRAYHKARFENLTGRRACDIDKLLDLVLTNDEIKHTINQRTE